MADEATPAAAEIQTVAPADTGAPVVPVVAASATAAPASPPAAPVIPTKADDPKNAAFADPSDDGDTDNFAAGEPVKPGAEPAVPARSTRRPPAELTDGPPEDVAPATPAAKPATKPAAPASASQSAAADDSLIARATEYGLTAKDIEDLGEDGILRAMTAYDRAASARAKAQLAKQNPPQSPPAGGAATAPPPVAATPPAGTTPPAAAATPAQPAATAAPASPPPSATPAPPATGDPEKLDLKINPDEFDPDTVALLNRMNDHYHARDVARQQALRAEADRLGKIEQLNAQHASRFQAEAAQRFEAEMDSFFDGLEGFDDVFGKGTIHSLAPESRQQRIAVVREMEVLAYADHQLGRQPSSPELLKQRALRVLHGDRIETNARDKVITQVAKRRSQSVARPTGGTTISKSGEQLAAERANQFYKDRGIDVEERNEEFADAI